MLVEVLLLSLATNIAAETSLEPTDFKPSFDGQLGVAGIIHQYWADDQVPDVYFDWVESWSELNPGAKYVLWTDESNRRLVERYYKWLLPAYDSLPDRLFRANFARYLYVHAFGGMYADIDMQALRPLSQLFTEHKGTAFLGSMDESPDSPEHVPNAWLLSRKDHPFWLFVIGEILRSIHQRQNVGETVGAKMLQRALKEYQKLPSKPEDGVTVLPPKAIFPVHWNHITTPCTRNDLETAEYSASNKCGHQFNGSFTVGYWVQEWRA